ncbi:MAG TPA: SUMF1/EgtB/PvdO family nonheme iron enzyme [Kofleriaceae bacterium]|jgi:serine/threonine protein kinase/formylglycine-generating enzyme required for sulfatase activity
MTLVNSTGAIVFVGSAWSPPDEFDEFRIVRSLGFGAMGQVYLAHDRLLDRPVALKFVHLDGNPAGRARVLDEARAIARLQHPNVVAIHRVAELAGHPFLVSEYVQGRALNELERPMPSRQVLDIALDLTRGLAAAHRRGVLHRDVKPANAVLTDEGHAKLLDFGLATILDGGAAEDLATTQPTGLVPSRGDGGDRTAGNAGPGDQTVPMRIAPGTSAVVDGPGLLPQIVGTPIYMAPEVWRGEAATRRSDLYSLGILLYELLAGAAPHRDVALAELSTTVQQRDIPRLGKVVPGVDPALAAVVDRLIERDPRARFPSADTLLAALEECAAPPVAVHPDGNPYRGLAAFDSAHASLFFGRGGEIRELVDRVRIEPFVVVGGDSGTGKSSLCRAGVLPWLAEHGGWSCVEIVPGHRPVRALAAALAPWTGSGEAAISNLLRDTPDAVARAIRRYIVAGAPEPVATLATRRAAPGRLLVFVDQLEELLTLSSPDEARTAAIAIAALAVRSPSIRVLTTARSDFLSRLAKLPELGDELARGLYFLRPLTGEHIREVIVRPAAVRGVVFESEALIDTLVAQTEHAPGGLPLLQFTLAELWDARDVAARTIRAEPLTQLGGVGGALTRHADRILAGLRTNERDAARRILLRLVTTQATRTRRSKAELLTEGPERDAERAALEVLVRGRVLVANNAQDGAYEIAHEALLTSWPTLQGWLQRDAVNHAIQERVEQAASAWQRMGRPRDLLWGRRQLAETRPLDRADLAPREVAFLAAASTAIRRRRVLGSVAAAVLVLGAVVTGLGIRTRARRELESMIDDQTRAATAAQRSARAIAAQRDVARSRALGQFETHRWDDGEATWTEVEAMALREESEYRSAAAHLESILLLDPRRDGLRGWFADLTFERLLRADRDRHRDLADELASRLLAYDDGRHQAELRADARVELAVDPPETRVWSERADTPRQLLGQVPLAPLALPPGSLVLAFEAPGHVPARLPVLLARGETLVVRVALPAIEAAPPGMLYVPPGRFLFGSADSSDARRQLFSTAPLHEVSTEGYFIARHEVTFAEWIEFLDQLPADERRRRTPRASFNMSSVALTELGPRRWRLTLTPTTRTYTAETGQPLHYEARTRRADQDWTKFPVSAVSYDDAVAFAGWLDRSGRVAGARLCDEYEWERAARGADGRTFPSGPALAPDDANIDVTYGREPLAFGPDEVGSHPGSRSPVGADDMAGNAWEWTRSVQTPGEPVIRGGSWYQSELTARSMNREYSEPALRTPLIGLRLCATPR